MTQRSPRPAPIALYRGLLLTAGVCGIALGVAAIIEAWGNVFALFLVVMSMLPIACGMVLMRLALAAGRGSGGAFLGSWLLAWILLIPVGALVFSSDLLFLCRHPAKFAQTSGAIIFFLICLAVCFIILGAAAIVGFPVWSRWHSDPSLRS